jgi:aspartokinase-like uncharacterized kinase
MYTIVYKLGGSLLGLPDLSQRLQEVLQQPLPFSGESARAERPNRLLIVGGGPIADAVRYWDQRHRLGDLVAHDLALHSMSFNAQFAAAIVSGARIVRTRAEARDAWADGCVAVLAAAEFVEAEERASGDLLPRSWDVTSDSVAAFVALHWPADALVLLKSVPLPGEHHAATPTRDDCVDAYFPQLARRLGQIGWANLRSDVPPTIQAWR